MEPIFFSADELNLMADDNFFRVKARIMKKVRATLDALYAELRSELNGVELLAPRSFNPKAHQ
ncbi:MAG TPA: hypothetical protein VGJ57_10980, partial [Nitrospirales bacterium]